MIKLYESSSRDEAYSDHISDITNDIYDCSDKWFDVTDVDINHDSILVTVKCKIGVFQDYEDEFSKPGNYKLNIFLDNIADCYAGWYPYASMRDAEFMDQTDDKIRVLRIDF